MVGWIVCRGDEPSNRLVSRMVARRWMMTVTVDLINGNKVVVVIVASLLLPHYCCY